MTKKAKAYFFVRGIAQYPSIHKIDDVGKFPTNKFKTDIIVEPAELTRVKASLKKVAKEAGIALTGKVPVRKNKDGDDIVRFRSGFIPKVFTAKNKPFTRGPIIKDKTGEEVPKAQTYLQEIGGGSELKVRGIILPYGDDDDVTFILDQVQVVQLKTWSAESAFDEEDGYDGEDDNGEASESAFGADAEEDSADDSEEAKGGNALDI